MNKKNIEKNKKEAIDEIFNKMIYTDKVSLQDQYAEEQEKQYPEGLPLVSTKEFIKSIRDSGYKSTATAINELIDNSIEADSTLICCLAEKEGTTVQDIYIIDDGHGMSPKALRTAVMWGGTHRHFDDHNMSTDGIGKYGFGFPSACLFLTTRYETYSKRKDGEWHALEINIKDVVENKMETVGGTGIVKVPDPIKKNLPPAVIKYLKAQLKIKMDEFLNSDDHKFYLNNGENEKIQEKVKQIQDRFNLKSGTVIKLSEVRKNNGLTYGYQQYEGFIKRFRQDLGATYRQKLVENGPELRLNNLSVTPVDPLFLTEGNIFYNQRGFHPKMTEDYDKELMNTEDGREKLWEQGIIAKEYEDTKIDPIEVRTDDGKIGYIRIRASIMHPKFGLFVDPKTKKLDLSRASLSNPYVHSFAESECGPNENAERGRFDIMNKYLYSMFVVTRAGRYIDQVDKVRWPKKEGMSVVRNEDRYWGVELDFDPVLDEYFGVTVNKQQIVLSEKLINILETNGVGKFLSQLHKEALAEFDKLKIERTSEKDKKEQNVTRFSQKAIAESGGGAKHPHALSEKTQREGEELFQHLIKELSEKENITEDEAKQKLLDPSQPFIMKHKPLNEEGPIFTTKWFSPGKILLTLNNEHPFITDVYYETKDSRFKDSLDALFVCWGFTIANHPDSLQTQQRQDKLNLSKNMLTTLKKLRTYYGPNKINIEKEDDD